MTLPGEWFQSGLPGPEGVTVHEVANVGLRPEKPAPPRAVPDNRKRLRCRVATFATDTEGKRSFGVGFRFGYWPCVGGPFIQFGLGFRRVSFWWGTP